MRIMVTGSEGFLGQNLVASLHNRGHEVVSFDTKLGHDLLDTQRLTSLLTGCEAVCHLAANADVRDGWSQPLRDLTANTVATAHLLEAMRWTGTKRLLFASSSSVYGDASSGYRRRQSHGERVFEPATRETWSSMQTSLYGASKQACEGLIGAYVEAGHVSATVLRLTSMLGPGYRHGLVADFVEKLSKSPDLELLGSGKIPRTRMDVTDGVAAFVCRLEEDPGWEVYNVGTDETITAEEVAWQVAGLLDVRANITVTGESWPGDHRILLDATKLRKTGWCPQYTISEGIARTVEWLTA